MSSYTYSAYLWPSLIAAVFIAFLAAYGFRHRKVPGALPFAIGCLFGVAWCLGSMLEAAAVDPATKIAWLKFVTVWELPVVTAASCFILLYAGWDRWLTRTTVGLLAIPPLLSAGFIATNGVRPLFWTEFASVGRSMQGALGPVGSAALDYSYILLAFNIGLLVWLFVVSPLRRRPVALMVVGQIGARLFFELGVRRLGFPREWDPDPVVLMIVFGLYAAALFRFHVFDPVPAARAAALDQMVESMLVVDPRGRIVEVNPAAERTLAARASSLRGRLAKEVLPAAALAERSNGGGPTETQFEQGSDGAVRHYRMEASPLRDKHGHDLGRLLLLHDTTEQKRAQAHLVEQQRVVATLQERERLARELHDSVGQVLGYVSLQAQTIHKWVHDGDREKAEILLTRLAKVAQDAHADVRESILALKAASSEDWSFLLTLRQYLDDFRSQYGVATELSVSDDVGEEAFTPNAAAQLLRVIQETLTNSRRHGEARIVRVDIGRDDHQIRVTLTDDGRGFDPASLKQDGSGHYGLAFMRERMAQIGGSLTIESRPGVGTSVRILAPIGTERVGQEAQK